jgi:hypothetical protein
MYLSLMSAAGHPDLRNLALFHITVREDDLLILLTDGVHDNLDPQQLGTSRHVYMCICIIYYVCCPLSLSLSAALLIRWLTLFAGKQPKDISSQYNISWEEMRNTEMERLKTKYYLSLSLSLWLTSENERVGVDALGAA